MEEYLAHVAKTGNALFVQKEIESVELSEASEDNSESVEGAIADKEAEEVSITKVSDEFRCEICDFTTNRRKELHIHISKKHAKIEQLDGNTTLCSESGSDGDNNNPFQTLFYFYKQ